MLKEMGTLKENVSCIHYCPRHAAVEQLEQRVVQMEAALEKLKHFCIDRSNAASDPIQARVYDRAATVAQEALAATGQESDPDTPPVGPDGTC